MGMSFPTQRQLTGETLQSYLLTCSPVRKGIFMERKKLLNILFNEISASNTTTRNKKTTNADAKSSRILATNVYIDNDTHHTRLNNNDLIIGPAGAGKTRGYVMPNLLSCNESMIVVDTKNTLYNTYSDYLMYKGARVYQIDFSGNSESDIGYNPFDYIRRDRNGYNEYDILMMAEQLTPISSPNEPFWDLSAKYVIASMIAYVCETLPEQEHNISALARIASDFDSYEDMLDEYMVSNADSIAIKYYNIMKSTKNAEKTRACISAFVFEKLIPLSNSASDKLFKASERLSIRELSYNKSVLFLNVSDTNHSLDALISLFYTQALAALMDEADRNRDNRLTVPVRFIFDDFAAGTTLPAFDKTISVIRSREIYVSIVIQSLSQLESLYSKPAAQTIVNNCDHWLYLGGHDLDTIEQISRKADKMVKNIANMPLDKVLVFERGKPAIFADKYDISMNAEYRNMLDFKDKLFQLEKEYYENLADSDLPFGE